MSDVIRLLPDSVANQIAAGEVIQRPASVVKELVENAVDAGATDIQVIIKDAGRTLIQVVDNGCGMSDTDARMAFERHATSKIERADDLFSLHTMGFRGEALASIAAVAQIDLRTMPKGAEVGTRIIINGSVVESQQPEACAPGSNMRVKNLFFNVPARRKFLKKDAVELSNIVREFERMSLVNPGLELTLIHNDGVMHKLLRSSLKQRICDLFGKSLEKQLIPVETGTSIVKIDGFVSRPEYARKRNQLQYLTVNGRHMRHPYFHKAILQCYETLIPSDEQPNYFLNFTVEPDTIDVNIHPTKNEIKFENEAAIWQILSAAVRESLGRFNAVPGIDFNVEDAPDIPVFNPNANGDHSVEIDVNYNPFAEPVPSAPAVSAIRSSAIGSDNSLRRTGTVQNWDKLYEGFMNAPEEMPVQSSKLNSADAAGGTVPMFGDDVTATDDATDDASSVQIKNRYIVTASISGMMVIDQYRAHVKVLYERYREQCNRGDIAPQQVLFPEVLHLSVAQNAVFDGISESLASAGFEFSFLGDNAWSITAVPSVMADANPADALLKIIDEAAYDTDTPVADVRDCIMLSMAKSAAVRKGSRLTRDEREHLISDLLKLPSPNYTPDGLPVIRIMSVEDIGRLFD